MKRWAHRKIRMIECNAKCRYLKKLIWKGASRGMFYLSEAPSLLWPHTPPSPYTLYTCVQYSYTHMEGGELTREKARGTAIVHGAGRKFQHDFLYLQSINSIKYQ